MPWWLPGDDYYTNFHVGDPYVKVDEGYARLPGAGYEALHPELKGVNLEDYPDINKLAILADVAPYSREYNTYRQKLGSEIGDNNELRIEYEKIINRVRQTKESSIRMDNQVSPSCRNQNHSRARAGSGSPSPCCFGGGRRTTDNGYGRSPLCLASCLACCWIPPRAVSHIGTRRHCERFLAPRS